MVRISVSAGELLCVGAGEMLRVGAGELPCVGAGESRFLHKKSEKVRFSRTHTE